MHVGQQSKETIFIEHFYIICFVLVKDIAQINFQKAENHA